MGGGVWSGLGRGLGGMLFPTSRPSAPTPIRSHRMAPYRSGALRPMGACRMAHQNLKSAGATSPQIAPKARESTGERLGGEPRSWQKGVQDIFQLGLASFRRPTSSRGQPTSSRPNSKTPRRRQFSCASFNHDCSYYFCVAFCRCVLARGLVKRGVMFIFFSSHIAQLLSQRHGRYQQPRKSQPRRRRAGPLNPYLPIEPIHCKETKDQNMSHRR